MEATQPASFFIHLNVRTSERAQSFFHTVQVQSFSLDNDKTNEKLVIKEATHRWGPMTISRYPTEAAEEWIEEMAKYEDEKHQNRIIRISL
jgi:hypothetical protein